MRPVHAWFLEITFVQKHMYVYVCVHPEAINNYSREMNLE